jgi:ADP-heptose:LPS heptosyltransferase
MIPAPERVLIFLLSGVGDTLMFTPALRLLRAAWPSARLMAVTMRSSDHDALAYNPDLDDIRYAPLLQQGLAATVRFLLSLRRERFDLSLLPCPSNRLHYNVGAFLSGARQRVAFRYLRQSRQNLDFLNTVLVPHRDNIHNVEHNLALAEALTGVARTAIPGWAPELRLPTVAADHAAAAAFLEQEGLAATRCVGLHVSSSRAKHMERKCWPKEHFLALIAALGQRHRDLRFILFCGDEDLPETTWLAAHSGPNVRVAMKLPFRTVAEVIRRCVVFVSNDSGVFHVACAMRTPTVAIFGPTNPLPTGPWQARAEVLRIGLPCSPCFYHTSHDLTCRAGLDFACLRDLPVEVVVRAVERLLAQGKLSACSV